MKRLTALFLTLLLLLCALPAAADAAPQYKAGDTVTFGSYAGEPIEWQVLEVRADGTCVLLSVKALDAMAFDKTGKNVTWENCSLRTWLNGTFYESAFSAAEKKQIVLSEVAATTNPQSGTKCAATRDYVYLMSVEEAAAYFHTDPKTYKGAGGLLCMPTNKAINDGAYQLDPNSISTWNSGSHGYSLIKGSTSFWLRTPGRDYQTSVVIDCGMFFLNGDGNYYVIDCVRPVICVRFEAAEPAAEAPAAEDPALRFAAAVHGLEIPAEEPAEPAAEPASEPPHSSSMGPVSALPAEAPAEEPAAEPAAEDPASRFAAAVYGLEAPAEEPAEPAAEEPAEPAAEAPAEPASEAPAEPAAEAPAEAPAEPVAEAPAVMTFDEYMAAEVDTPVVIEGYIQLVAYEPAYGNACLYLADDGSAYYVYRMPVTPEEAEELTVGRKIRVSGYKAEWAGEIEIADATFSFINDGSTRTEITDITVPVSNNVSLEGHMNQHVSIKGLTVIASKSQNGNDVPFLYNWDGSGAPNTNCDLYFRATLNGNMLTFCVESSEMPEGSDAYTAVTGLKIGDVIDVEGFLYWYNGPNPHVTAVTVVNAAPDPANAFAAAVQGVSPLLGAPVAEEPAEEPAEPVAEVPAEEPAADDPALRFAAAVHGLEAPAEEPAAPAAEPADASGSWQAGDTLTFGTWDGAPIEWQVLEVKEDGTCVLMSVHTLIAKPYNENKAATTWADCSLRKWLNGTFYNTAFTDTEKGCIRVSHLTTPANPSSHVSGGKDTDDRVYVLSLDEVGRYFDLPAVVDTKGEALLCFPTAGAVSSGASTVKQDTVDNVQGNYSYTLRAGTGWWWLRTPGDAVDSGMRVNCFGVAGTGYGVGIHDIGVRPVIAVKF